MSSSWLKSTRRYPTMLRRVIDGLSSKVVVLLAVSVRIRVNPGMPLAVA